MPETIFSKILAGEVPCYRVYEDAMTLAFMDVAPLTDGHVLVIPKEPAATLDTLSEESAAALGRVLPRLCRAVMAATRTQAYNVLQNNGPLANQGVHHVHFHIIPKAVADSGLHVVWRSTPQAPERLAAMANQITAALRPAAEYKQFERR